ncbi:MAG: oxidoreductase-like domain-containing protein [Burkholderiales bacterium]
MTSMPTAADDDPRPEPPLPPAPDECCGSGCNPCVFDLYEEALERYRVRLEAWMQRHGGAEK